MSKLYPQLMEHVQITVYDVADKILPMFDETLHDYAVEHFSREGVTIKTNHSIRELRRGFPRREGTGDFHDDVKASGYTLKLQDGEESEIGCGLVVWSTGLMSNPFVKKALSSSFTVPASCIRLSDDINSSPDKSADWKVQKHPRTGSIITDDFLRVQLEGADQHEDRPAAVLRGVFALGDCATIQGTADPATAQVGEFSCDARCAHRRYWDGSSNDAILHVATQKAKWLAKKLNKGDINTRGFSFVRHVRRKVLFPGADGVVQASQGVMAYVGSYRAIVQMNQGSLSGKTAWLMWRGAYLSKSISWRNRLLIPMYWYVLIIETLDQGLMSLLSRFVNWYVGAGLDLKGK